MQLVSHATTRLLHRHRRLSIRQDTGHLQMQATTRCTKQGFRLALLQHLLSYRIQALQRTSTHRKRRSMDRSVLAEMRIWARTCKMRVRAIVATCSRDGTVQADKALVTRLHTQAVRAQRSRHYIK